MGLRGNQERWCLGLGHPCPRTRRKWISVVEATWSGVLCRGSARKSVRGSVLGWDQGYKKQMLLKPRSCLITRLINLEHDDLNMALNLEKETTPVVFSMDLISPSKAHAFCLQTEREFYYLCVDSFHYFFFNTYCNVSQWKHIFSCGPKSNTAWSLVP